MSNNGRGIEGLITSPSVRKEQTLETQTATATVAILQAIEGLPTSMATVAFDNAKRIIEAGKAQRGESIPEIAEKLREHRRKKGWFS